LKRLSDLLVRHLDLSFPIPGPELGRIVERHHVRNPRAPRDPDEHQSVAVDRPVVDFETADAGGEVLQAQVTDPPDGGLDVAL
jgi:hypothetical protein